MFDAACVARSYEDMSLRIVLGAIAMAALATLIYLGVSQRDALSRQAQLFQVQKLELEKLQAENAGLRGLRDQQAEIDQLRENTQDLMRLRNEVRLLQDQARQVEQLKAANDQLLQLMQAAHLSPEQQSRVAAIRAKGAALGVVPALGPGAADVPGVRIGAIAPNAPASHSGLLAGDVILRVDGHATETLAQLQTEMLTKQPGETVVLDLLRSNEVIRLPVQTMSLPQ